MKRVAIVGGGVSGMSAAYYLEKARRAGAEIEWQLFEQSPRLGGIVGTEHVSGCVVETGADSFVSEKPWAFELCRELGLEDQLIGSNDASRKTSVLVGGKLVPLPEGLQFIVPTSLPEIERSPLFSEQTKRMVADEVKLAPRNSKDDESVAAFVARHFGQEFVDRLAEPMLAGVYGGRASDLSVRTVLPRFVHMEEEHGSLIRALQSKTKPTGRQPNQRSIFTSFKNGMQQLLDALRARLDPARLHMQCAVSAVAAPRKHGSKWKVSTATLSEEFDAVVLAVPAPVAGRLLQRDCSELSQELAQIAYSSSLIVSLGFPREKINEQQVNLEGFGFLVPATEKHRLLACTFVANKFNHRVPGNLVLLRGFIGGARDEAAIALPDSEAIALVRQELAEILGIRSQPVLARVFRWPRSMPQYAVGHLDRIARIEQLRRNVPGLYLIGNAYRGVGVPDCIREGRDAAEEITTT